MKTTNLFILNFFILFCGVTVCCTTNLNQNEKATVATINKEAYAGNDKLSQLLSVERLIPIRDSEVFLYRIDKISIQDSLLHILDKKQNLLLTIDYDGNVKQVINKTGSGPDEFLSIDDFAIDKLGNFYIFDATSEKICQYDNRGNHIKTIKACFGRRMLFLNDGRFAIHVGGINNTNIVILDAEGNRVKEYPLRKEPIPVLIGQAACLGEYNGDLYFSNPLDLCIYKIESDKQVPWLTFDFENEKDPKQLLEFSNKDEFVKQFKEYKGVTNLAHWTIFNDKVIGTTNMQKTYCYDLRSKEILYFNEIEGIEKILFVSPWFVNSNGKAASYITAQSIFGLANSLDLIKDKMPLFEILGEEESQKYMENDWILIGRIN